MAGSEEVLQAPWREGPGVRLPVLVPNRQGFERARAAGAREIAVFTAASETFNRKNTNATIDESFARFAEFVPEAKREGLWVRGYISTVLRLSLRGPGALPRGSRTWRAAWSTAGATRSRSATPSASRCRPRWTT